MDAWASREDAVHGAVHSEQYKCTFGCPAPSNIRLKPFKKKMNQPCRWGERANNDDDGVDVLLRACSPCGGFDDDDDKKKKNNSGSREFSSNDSSTRCRQERMPPGRRMACSLETMAMETDVSTISI